MANYRDVRHGSGVGYLRQCKGCCHLNFKKPDGRYPKHCRCGVRFKSDPPKQKPKRGTPERLVLELRHAERMAAQWGQRVKRAVSKWDEWSKRSQHLAVRIQKGPEPAKPRKKKGPRAIKLGGDL